MAYQEPQTVPQKLEGLQGSDASTTETTFGFSSLSLGTSITTGVAHKSPCAKCGFCPAGSNSGSLKRASPCSPSPSSVLPLRDDHHPPPKPKKLFLDPLPYSNLASSKISLPPSSYPPTQTPNQSLLRRCVSDPYKSPEAANNAGPTTLSPEHAVNIGSTPSQNNLRRCFSDPCKSPVAATNNNLETSQSQELAAQGSTSDVALLPPAHRQSVSGAPPHAVTNLRSFAGKMDNGDSECTNYVSVERSGESFVVHFNCNCGKDCQILVNGGSYYYKLA
ncbi:hypothetical protein FNV43_RR19012 [Rhamnella rubrinervis]|uniref:Uncharacterized protein n=1 Tax=Rhamnella rubrinervis TaxID=2594499 RepID=A0A8K0GWK0_9ROSA|nr:hypothetical protein FNV43_RR19012 [Rhamnella rubrinervis]